MAAAANSGTRPYSFMRRHKVAVLSEEDGWLEWLRLGGRAAGSKLLQPSSTSWASGVLDAVLKFSRPSFVEPSTDHLHHSWTGGEVSICPPS